MKIDPAGRDIDLAQSEGRLEIEDFRGTVKCPGGRPRTDAVDAIVVGDTDLDLDLARGPFGPGLTPETDGSSELEVFAGRGVINVYFGARAEQLSVSRDGRDRVIDVSPASSVDPEITIDDPSRGLFGASIGIYLGGGADRVRASGAQVQGETLQFELGMGADEFVGGAGGDGVMAGGGRDEVSTGGGRDGVVAGGGSDRIATGVGGDFVHAERGGRDTLDCGAGADRAIYDRADSARSCRRLKPAPPNDPPPPIDP